MAAPPKTKPPSAPATQDRTSAVVSATLILLTVLGVVTVFWEPLTALAGGAPATEAVGETRAAAPDAGALAAPSATAAADASGSS
ncbi:MAG TPA: hypothetical protein VHL80_09735 [Polyangia bacterium]|nr:hypothetical protein [Polyangia bacterium]